jgi:endonuclease YncB( thermonuclease family)
MTDSARVVDGDTLEIADGQRIRLWGVDAVEGSQVCYRDGQPWRCGDNATAALRKLVRRSQADL